MKTNTIYGSILSVLCILLFCLFGIGAYFYTAEQEVAPASEYKYMFVDPDTGEVSGANILDLEIVVPAAPDQNDSNDVLELKWDFEDSEPNWIYYSEDSAWDTLQYSNIVISTEDGNEVMIDFSGSEVVVTGATEEGARVFFEELLKPMIDDYIRAENLKERVNEETCL